MKNKLPEYKVISNEEGKKLFTDFKLKSDKFVFSRNIILFEGDTYLELDIDADFLDNISKLVNIPSFDILITGNLNISGRISLQLPGNKGTRLIILGNVTAKSIENDFSLILIIGDANIQTIVYGMFPEGLVDIRGTLKVPYLINSTNHQFRIGKTSPGTIFIKTSHDHDREDWYRLKEYTKFTYTYNDDLRKIFIKKVIRGLNDIILGYDLLNTDDLIELIENKTPVLKDAPKANLA